jgi:hypothetical protein
MWYLPNERPTLLHWPKLSAMRIVSVLFDNFVLLHLPGLDLNSARFSSLVRLLLKTSVFQFYVLSFAVSAENS